MSNTAALGADLLTLLRKSVGLTGADEARAGSRKPFRFLLCGDPALVAEFRGLLLRGHPSDTIPFDSAATLETIDPRRGPIELGPDVRCILFFGRRPDAAGADFATLAAAKLPILNVTVDPAAAAGPGPLAAPHPGSVAEYVVPALTSACLRIKVFPHLVDCCRGLEVAVGRRLPAMRETVAVKLTRGVAASALKVAAASALVDSVPVFGFVVGAVTSAGDMVAITGLQVGLMMQIGAVYDKDPDVQGVWNMLPVVGGGFGWRALARELSGFIPVAGIPIKGAIAYAGTVVVGEATTFFYEHGRHMTAEDAGALYSDAKAAATTFARDVVARLRNR
jgi:uncharacterized protein (DUF697 family)